MEMFPTQEKVTVVSMKKRIVIVGAGITGASIAWHLAHLEFDVTVIEQNMPASGATGSAFGWLTGVVCDDAPDVLLRRAALEDWHRLEEQIPELQINWGGSLKYGATSQACLPEERLLDTAEIASLEPALVLPPSEARYAAKDGAIDAIEATRILLDKACGKGVVVQNQTTVEGFCMTKGKVTGVLTSQGQLEADCVVLACGTGIPALTKLMGTPVPVLASPAVLLRFAAPQCVVKTLIAGDDIEVRHSRNGDLLAAEDYPANGSVRETVIAAQASIRSRLRGAESASLTQYSIGERPVPQDEYPVLGFTDESEGVYVAVMHPAVTCAATIGRLVSEELRNGKNDEIPEIYRLSRFGNKPL
ncbi:FAD-binding oxidoreductase (plasmid) [Pantoea agglomerans]|jgi:glycine/D-amino acid oxidase-like deaminating enzyme|nr:FAD-binding oxidoreductase [Pantoea agglomerans]QAV52253.1 FAD-binding oxidoreductase [Pantoea agglomerans]